MKKQNHERQQQQQAPVGVQEEQAASEELDTYGESVLQAPDGKVVRNPDTASLKPNLAPDQLRCNFSVSDFRGKALLVACTNPATIRLSEDGTATIRACYWATFPDQGVSDKDGQVISGLRTVLVDRDGNTYKTWSDGIGRKIEDIFGLFSEEEIKAGLPIRIQERKSKRPGRTYLALTVELPTQDRG